MLKSNIILTDAAGLISGHQSLEDMMAVVETSFEGDKGHDKNSSKDQSIAQNNVLRAGALIGTDLRDKSRAPA
jgi:hypothetical protein